MEVDNIVSIFNQEKGMKSFLDFRFSDIVEEAAKRGYHHVEITLDIFQILPVKVDEKEQERMRVLKDEYDLTFSAHFPIWSIELASPNKFIREASVQSMVSAYKTFEFLDSDIETYVIHPTGPFASEIMNAEIPPKYKGFIMNLFIGFAVKSIKSLLKQTKMEKTKLAVENIEFPFEGTLNIIDKLRGPKLLIDTAHFLGGFSGDQYATGEGLVEATEKYLDRTSEIHLQDFSAGGGADHAALGTGHFPPEFLDVIRDREFEGPVVFELSFMQAKESLEYIKKHAPDIELPDVS